MQTVAIRKLGVAISISNKRDLGQKILLEGKRDI